MATGDLDFRFKNQTIMKVINNTKIEPVLMMIIDCFLFCANELS